VSEAELVGLLREHATKCSVPGAAIGILRDGVLKTEHYGIADVTTGEPVTPETRFAVGSLCKTMVATAIARLAEAGRFSLDDPAAAHVPELEGVQWAERASIRDLLANRAGCPLCAELDFTDSEDDDDAVLARFAASVAAKEPIGRFWSYTNAGWCLLGRALETVVGLVWEDAMRESLLGPLGLEQTTFATHTIAGLYATGHEVRAGGQVVAERWMPRSLGPAGSTLQSTITDMLRLASAQLDDPAVAVLRTTHADVRIPAWFDAWCLGCARFDWNGGPVWGGTD